MPPGHVTVSGDDERIASTGVHILLPRLKNLGVCKKRMGNDCWNYISFTNTAERIEAFLSAEFKDVPEWAIRILRRGKGGVYLKLFSKWFPDFKWLESLLERYPESWIKNEWSEEGGYAGVWVGTNRGCEPTIRRLEWEDLCLEEEHSRFCSDSEGGSDEDDEPQEEFFVDASDFPADFVVGDLD